MLQAWLIDELQVPPTNENGEPFPAPRLRHRSLMPWQRPRGVAIGTHRKSGVFIALPLHARWSLSSLGQHTSFILLCETNCKYRRY